VFVARRPRYRWKQPGITDLDPQIAGEEIDRLIEENDGSITPEQLLESAKSRKSPLHSFFEWNDRRAAGKHRLTQAKWMLRSIITVTAKIAGRKKAQETRIYHPVRVTKSDRMRYIHIERAKREPTLLWQVAERALRELEYWQRTYSQYQELFDLVQETEPTGKKLRKKVNQLKKKQGRRAG
jgi:hypothetical protein